MVASPPVAGTAVAPNVTNKGLLVYDPVTKQLGKANVRVDGRGGVIAGSDAGGGEGLSTKMTVES